MMLVDIAFFVSFALAYSKIWEKIMVNVNAVLGIMGVSMEEFAGVQSEAQLSALAARYSGFMAYYRNIGYYLGMLFAILLAMWCIFQGVNWFLAHKAMGKKKLEFFSFMGKFSLLTVVWWALFLLIISLYLKLSAQASMDAIPIVSANAAAIIAWLLLFALFYLAYTSYAIAPKHRTRHLFQQLLKASYKEYRALAPACIFAMLLMVVEYLLFMKSFAFGGTAAGAFAVIVLLPTISWSRFYAITAAEK